MKSNEIIPRRNEIFFVLKLTAIIIASLIVSLSILFVFLNKNLGGSYPAAFKIISDVFAKMNITIFIAVFAQLCLSSILLFFVVLVFSHKIAGPMFRLKRILKQYGEGEELDKISFRRTDFLPGVSRWFSEFFAMQKKREMLVAEAEFLLREIDAEVGKDNSAKLERIKAVVAELENVDVS
ncbi:hypothetical protein ACFLT2_03125 [Acidobacteriota bacterium]